MSSTTTTKDDKNKTIDNKTTTTITKKPTKPAKATDNKAVVQAAKTLVNALDNFGKVVREQGEGFRVRFCWGPQSERGNHISATMGPVGVTEQDDEDTPDKDGSGLNVEVRFMDDDDCDGDCSQRDH